ncbi:MAG: hypothetical protein Q3Y08_02690 [Butyricicoccus sp.]|nr:hypothetical protein [Butyricicoccus sp.]
MSSYNIRNISRIYLHLAESANELAPTLSMVEGAFLVDGKPTNAYYGNKTYYWEQGDASGCLYLDSFGLPLNGFLECKGTRRDFRCDYEIEFQMSYTSSANQEVPMRFCLGREEDETGDGIFYCKFWAKDQLIVDHKKGDPLQTCFQMPVGEELCIDLDLSTIWSIGASMMPNGFFVKNLHMVFGATFNDLTGSVTEIEGPAGGDGGVHNTLKGEVVIPEQDQVLYRARAAFQASQQTNARLKENFRKKVGAEPPCSIDELYTIPEPSAVVGDDHKVVTGQQQVQNKSAETLYYLAVYYMADTSSEDVSYADMFGITKEYAKTRVEEISATLLDLVKDTDVQSFLEQYAKATLGNAVAKSSDAQLQKSLDEISDPAGRCAYYMSGTTHDGAMNQNPGFSKAMQQINKYVYSAMSPTLRKYYANGPYWAQKLYDYAVARKVLLKASTIEGMSKVTHLSMILTFLDDQKHEIPYQSGGKTMTASLPYGAALYMQIYNLSMAEMMNNVNFEADGKTTFLQIMENVFGVMYDELAKEKSDKFSDEILKEIKEELAEYGELTRKEFIDQCLNIADEAISGVGAIGDLLQCFSRINKWCAEHPKTLVFGKCAALSMYAFSMFFCAQMFTSWSELNTLQKAEAVGAFLAGAANAGETALRWLSIKTLLNPNASLADKLNAATRLKFGGENFDVIQGIGHVGGTDLVETTENAARYVSSIQSSSGVTTQLSRFTKLFRIGEIALRIVNVVLLALAVVITTLDIIADFKNNRSAAIKALDILDAIGLGAAVILEAVSMTLDLVGVVCDAIPIVGAICMLVGLIFSVAGMIVKAKSDPPMIRFIKTEIVPFLQNLPVPPVTSVSTAPFTA